MLAVSSTFCTRLMACARCCTNCLAMAHEIAQVANGLGRNEAGGQQAVPQQVRQPFTVLDIGLVTRNGLHMLRIDQNDLKTAFQDVKDRTPIDAGTFHADVGHALTAQPVSQSLQLDGGGAKGAHLAVHLAGRPGEQHTRHHRLLMDIESGTVRIQHAETHCVHALLSAILAWTTKRGRREARKDSHVSCSYSRGHPW